MSEEIKIHVLKNIVEQSKKVYGSRTESIPQKKFDDSLRNDYERVKSIDKILGLLGISKDEYKTALSTSQDKGFQIHLKRLPNLCFVNNHFSDRLLWWEAILDIQIVLNHYMTAMCSYLSKCEDECYQATSVAVKEGFKHILDNYRQWKSEHTSDCVYHNSSVLM